ncbi:MAG: hypothetical protein SFY80_08770 [Verrucomicrobiota bacterium]|nr:hypothetical protein [Verrucomicrobiota bacterium]
MLVRPLQLHTHIRLPQMWLDPVPWINVGLLVLFWGVMETRFISAPGLTLDLPRSQTTQLAGLPVSSVLTAKALGPDGEHLLLLFEGQIVPYDRLLGVFTAHNTAAASGAVPVLLLKADRNVRAQQLFALCETARMGGFESVQMAAEVEQQAPAASGSGIPLRD